MCKFLQLYKIYILYILYNKYNSVKKKICMIIIIHPFLHLFRFLSFDFVQ